MTGYSKSALRRFSFPGLDMIRGAQLVQHGGQIPVAVGSQPGFRQLNKS